MKPNDFPHDASGELFNHIMRKNDLKNDLALSKFLGMSPPNISKIRNGINKVSAGSILQIHDSTGLSIKKIRALIAGESQ